MDCKKITKQSVEKFLQDKTYKHLDIKCALIDMDGTLYNSMINHTAAWYRMMTEMGIKCDRDEFYEYEGMTGAQTINVLFQRAFGKTATDDEVKELYHKKTLYFQELPKTGIMPGAEKMLEILAQNGIKRVLVTGSGQASLLDRLQRDFPGVFTRENMITSKDVTHGKPSPEPYLKGLEIAGVKPNEAIVIENAPLGIKSGADAGIFTVGVTTGPIKGEKMLQAGANILYNSMEEFSNDLQNLINATKEI